MIELMYVKAILMVVNATEHKNSNEVLNMVLSYGIFSYSDRKFWCVFMCPASMDTSVGIGCVNILK